MEGGSVQQAPPSMLNVFGVDPKHFNKWLRVWEEKRPYGQVQPDPQHPKKLNTVATDFLLRSIFPYRIIFIPFFFFKKKINSPQLFYKNINININCEICSLPHSIVDNDLWPYACVFCTRAS